MSGITTLDKQHLGLVSGGLAPIVVGVYSIVTSKSFVAFATTITLIGTAADIGTELLE